MEAKPGERNPTVAALLSFVIPGLGQVYNGEAMKGVLLFFTSIFLVPWVIAVIDAYYVARLMNLEEQVAQRS
ncbi:hypothetical protein HY251_18490 [bacterium]|nr:hypothetical protein [bacterium]